MWRRWALLLLIATMAASPDARRFAAAQEPDEPEEPAAAPAPLRPRVQISDRQFERWLIGGDGDAESARRLIEARLKSRIGYIDRVCGITRQQVKKLEVAGHGDIKRFFDRVEQMREEMRRAASDTDIFRLDRLASEAQVQGRILRGQIFAGDSMFAKTLRTTLDRDQAARFRRHWDEDLLQRFQSRVEWVALTLQKNLALSDDQRFRLLVVLLEETRPPRHFGPSDYYGIMYQASQIPAGKLRPIFAESEWRSIREEFDEARRQKPMLKSFGYIPDDRPVWDTARGGPLQGRGDAVEGAPADPRYSGVRDVAAPARTKPA